MTLYDSAKKDFLKTIDVIAGRHTPEQVFTDFVSMAAMSISNAVDFKQEREKKYLDLIGKYEPDEQARFPELLAITTKGFEAQFGDFLGECFEELGASNSKTGQFFTPYSVARLCAQMSFDKEQIDAAIAENGYVGINEPAAGGGAMIVAFLETMKENGYNFQTQSLTVAQDIDYRCAYMCYITLSLLGAPAIVCIGDTLTLEIWEELHTPFYVLNYLKFRNFVKYAESKALPVINEQETPVNAPSGVESVKKVLEPTPPVKQPVAAFKEEKNGQFSLF
jgi:hypothetical protein